MKRHIKQIIADSIWVFYNIFVNKIPIACVRKILYQIGGLRIKEGSRIGLGTIIIHPWKIKIGSNTVINEFCYLDGRGGLSIGNYVSISIYSKILTASHNAHSEVFEYVKNRVVIEDFCWIGLSAIILDGSFLNKGTVIGANAVVKQTTNTNSIYVGNPLVYLRKRRINDVSFTDISYFK